MLCNYAYNHHKLKNHCSLIQYHRLVSPEDFYPFSSLLNKMIAKVQLKTKFSIDNGTIYKHDFPTHIMNKRFKTFLLFGVVAVLCGSGYGITSSTASAQSNYSLKVGKDTAGDFTVSNGASFVGSNFDTTYTITGPALD